MTITIYKDAPANAIFIEDANGAQFLNSLHASMEDPADTTIDITDLARSIYVYYQVEFDQFVDQTDSTYGATALDVCNALNAIFTTSGTASGAPSITSSTSISLTVGDTLNYELTATGGVGYEWDNLPSGVLTVEGNVRKLIGGSTLAAGTYTPTMRAVNYFGVDEKTLTITVSSPPFSDTKSVNFVNQDYLGANAAALDAELGRSANGSGAGDAWSISLWFKPSTSSNGQTIFYFGAADVTNSGFVEIRFIGNNDRLRLRYGSNNNYIQAMTATNSLTHSAWNHILVTYDGGTTGAASGSLSDYYSRFKIFIDGTLQPLSNANKNYGYSGAITGENLRVGRFASGTYMRDNCRVDELAVWSSDQSGNISDIYNSGATHDLSLLSAPPAHWWRMGDGDTYPNIQDNIGSATFVMYNMTASDIVSDTP
ncbi:MAG: LamG domain-containing protein [Epibacterium sp.]|nr:LamG domain-containing protein [Epibacterium sp.]NQX73870.1 LamG domain-containing protein [Epibacterium sp.]